MSTKITGNIFEPLREISRITSPSHLEMKLVTEYPGYHLPDGTSKTGARSVAVISHFPAAVVDLDKTISFEWYNTNTDTSTDGLVVSSEGSFVGNISDALSKLATGSYSAFIIGKLLSANTTKLSVASFGDFSVTIAVKNNWVKWSDIGNLDFTINKSNVAGDRPLDWYGSVYAVKKLGDKVIAYGENGVSALVPIEKTYGLNTIYNIGVESKGAVAGSDRIHFFIDNTGQLFSLSEELKILGYSEFFSAMSGIVLSWDGENNVLYICDGDYGYVYSPIDKSLGTCSPLITGVSSQYGILYASASGTIVTPAFEICTDIFDFGTHRNKTIFELEFGTNVTGTLQAAIDYRNNFKSAFTQTAWKDVATKGNVFITALGREFRIRAKMTSYEYIEMDYITVNGIVHAH